MVYVFCVHVGRVTHRRERIRSNQNNLSCEMDTPPMPRLAVVHISYYLLYMLRTCVAWMEMVLFI